MSGECVATVAMQEGNHFHTLPRQTRRDGNTISGDKTLVMDAGAADYLIVSAVDAADELCLAVVPRDADGVTLLQKPMDGRQYASLTLRDVEAEEWLTGETLTSGFARACDEATIMLSCEMLGGCRELLERTVAYLREREQFDVKIGTFQALQHRLATAYCELELACGVSFSCNVGNGQGRAGAVRASEYGQSTDRGYFPAPLKRGGADARRHGRHRRDGYRPVSQAIPCLQSALRQQCFPPGPLRHPARLLIPDRPKNANTKQQ